MTSSAEQNVSMREFYEGAWSARWQWMKALIDKGARHPLTVIRNFQAFERRYQMDNEGDELVWAFAHRHEKELLPSGTPAFRQSSLRGQLTNIPFHVEDQCPAFLVDFIAAQGPFDLVVELGCGYGRNLFNIAYSGVPFGTRFAGGELTSSGVTAATAIAALDPGLDITFHHFDYLEPDLGWIKPGKRCLVFTCHSIEQVHRIDRRPIEAICGLGDSVIAVHMEPFGFQAQPGLGPVTARQKSLYEEKRWNLNLVQVLQDCAKDGLIGLDFMATEIFLPADALNPTSVAIWHKAGG